MPTFFITGLYHTRALNDSTLPPIEVEAEELIFALASIGATVWTEEQFREMRQLLDDKGLNYPEPIKYPDYYYDEYYAKIPSG